MKTARRPLKPQRRIIFIGCEGASEAGYAALLQVLANEAGLHIHLKIENLGHGAGDPQSRIAKAVRKLEHQARTLEPVEDRFVLLDADQAEADPVRAASARGMAVDNNIAIVWQRPCFEAVLLRHLPGFAAHRPPETPGAERALKSEWPEYSKAMSRAELARRIDIDAVKRAATVEEELRAMLICLGLIT